MYRQVYTPCKSTLLTNFSLFIYSLVLFFNPQIVKAQITSTNSGPGAGGGSSGISGVEATVRKEAEESIALMRKALWNGEGGTSFNNNTISSNFSANVTPTLIYESAEDEKAPVDEPVGLFDESESEMITGLLEDIVSPDGGAAADENATTIGELIEQMCSEIEDEAQQAACIKDATAAFALGTAEDAGDRLADLGALIESRCSMITDPAELKACIIYTIQHFDELRGTATPPEIPPIDISGIVLLEGLTEEQMATLEGMINASCGGLATVQDTAACADGVIAGYKEQLAIAAGTVNNLPANYSTAVLSTEQCEKLGESMCEWAETNIATFGNLTPEKCTAAPTMCYWAQAVWEQVYALTGIPGWSPPPPAPEPEPVPVDPTKPTPLTVEDLSSSEKFALDRYTQQYCSSRANAVDTKKCSVAATDKFLLTLADLKNSNDPDAKAELFDFLSGEIDSF